MLAYWRLAILLAGYGLAHPHTAASRATVDRTEDAGAKTDLFRLLVESIKDYAIFVLDPDGNILTWSPGAQAMKGYTRDEIVGQHFSKFYPAEAVQSSWPQRELAIAERDGRFADEGWRVRKDGSTFWASVIITPLRSEDGSLTGFAKITQDMTERRASEEKVHALNKELRQRVAELDEARRVIELRTLELQKLSGQLLHIQDEERRRIARNLHDDLGQQLSVLKMMLPKNEANREAADIIDSAAESVRSLSYLLHPPLLDETGLRAALDWYTDGLAKRSGLDISLTMTPPVFPRLSREIETTIFRVVQESLTNVYRHAHSDTVRIEIVKQPESVTVRVRDYGTGIPAEVGARVPSKLGVGISGMRERVRQFGGDLMIRRAEPGTLIEAKILLFG